MTLETQHIEGQRQDQGSDRNDCSDVIEMHFTSAATNARLLECSPAKFGNISGLTAITSGGFAGPHLVIEADVQPLHFTGMDRSSVVATRSGSSPCVDALSSGLNAHRVTCFDCLDSVPPYCDGLQGIGDADSFVKDFNLWMYKEQIGTAQYECCPTQSNEVCLDGAAGNGLANENEDYQRCHSGREPHSARPEQEAISHVGIFSQQSGLEGSKK